MNFVSQPVAVRREGDDVTVGKVCDDEALPREGQVGGVCETRGGVQRPEQVSERCVDQDRPVWKTMKEAFCSRNNSKQSYSRLTLATYM